MIIRLDKSKLFTEDPALRFAKAYDLDGQIWRELWRRYKLLEYTVPELCEYTLIKTGKVIHKKAMYRWIARGEIYVRAIPAIKRGATTVSTSFFEPYEEEVIREITKNMKGGLSESSYTLI